jgi:antirestriction protein ArdC
MDEVRLPKPEQFDTGDAYYATAFHEFVHSTGHESRLNRLDSTTFGSEPYAQEELVAEIGASMLCAFTGIEPKVEASAAYIGTWLRVLRDDKRFIVQAAAKAQKATDLILGTKFEEKETSDKEEATATAVA